MRDYLLPVRRALLDAQPAEPYQRRAPRVVSGPKTRSAHQNVQPGWLPDWAVLEIRRLHAVDGLPLRSIAPHMAAVGIDCTSSQVRMVLEYRARLHLDPEPGRREPYTAPVEEAPAA